MEGKKKNSVEILLENNEPNEIEQDNNPDTINSEVISQLYSVENIHMKTDITKELGVAMARGLIFADEYQCEPMFKLIHNIEVLFVSNDRKGREELVKVAESVNTIPEPEIKQGITKNLW